MKTWVTDLLKKIIGNGFLLLLIVSVFYILYLRECKRSEPCPAKDEVIVKKDVWENMTALANKPPVVRVDTFWKKGTVIIPNPQPPLPKPVTKDSTNTYADSLVNKEIDVFYTFKIKGELLSRKWFYKPITTIINVDSLIYVPYPVEINKPVKTLQKGLYVYGIAGGNKNTFLFGGGVDFITKKETEIGYMYQRFGSQGFHSIKLGGKIRIGRN